MTIKKTVALLLAVMMLAASTAFAATTITGSTSGTSNGGTMGKCTCGGKLVLTNATPKDKAVATTTSGAKGKLSAIVKIYWSNGETTVNRSNSTTQYDTSSASATVYADNEYGTKGNGSFAYTSSEYGTWYGTVNKNY